MIQLTLTALKMTTAQVIKTSVNENSPIQDYDYPNDHAPPTQLSYLIVTRVSNSSLFMLSDQPLQKNILIFII